MPPKKPHTKAPVRENIEIDHVQYTRKSIDIFPENTPELIGFIGQSLRNCETIFPEWKGVTDEIWDSTTEISNENQIGNDNNYNIYPAHWKILESTTLRALAGYEAETVDVGKNKKKDIKKKDAAVVEFIDAETDANGKLLPRVFIGRNTTDNNSPADFKDTNIPRGFQRHHSSHGANPDIVVGVPSSNLSDVNKDDRIQEEFIIQEETIIEGGEEQEKNDQDKDDIRDDLDVGNDMLCQAFLTVSRYAQLLGSADSNDSQYLWRNIYPQNNEGRPCFNPAGKYCVRLFLAGRWRKVVVNDTVPIVGAGETPLARSEIHLELWPTILAKAIYTVFSACGYTGCLKNTNTSVVSTENTLRASQFVSFAVHLLTSWQPGLPEYLTPSTLLDQARELVDEGIPFIEPDWVPVEVPVDVSESDASRDRSELKTKAALQREFQLRAAHRQRILADIKHREELIHIVQEAVWVSRSQATLLCRMGAGAVDVFPVLAVSFSSGDSNSTASLSANEGDVRVLVAWSADIVGPQQPDLGLNHTVETSVTAVDISLAAEFVSPAQSAIQSTWLSLAGLVQEGGLFVRCRSVHRQAQAQLSHHWRPTGSAAGQLQQAGTGLQTPVKGAAKDGKTATAAVAKKEKVATIVPAPGTARVNTTTFEAPPLHPTLLVIDASTIEEDVVAGHITHIKLRVFVQADVVAPAVESPAVLLLEQFSLDTSEAATPAASFRVEVDTALDLPVASVIISLPTSLVSNNRLVFWVRSLCTASLFVQFHCSLPLQLGDVDTIWSQLGGHVTVKEGEVHACAKLTEYVICRSQISVVENESIREGDNLLLPAVNTQHPVFVCLYIPNTAVASRVALLLGDDEFNHNVTALPLAQGVFFVRSTTTTAVSTLIARLYSADVETPAFKWKLTLLSQCQLLCSVSLPDKPTYRYSGGYVPNNRLRVFKDVLSLDKTSSPLAFRLNIGTSDDVTTAGVRVGIRVSHRADNQVLFEAKGSNILQCYWLPVSSSEENALATANAGKSDAKKDKSAAKKGAAPECVDLLLECFLDESAMNVPRDWRSNQPHKYDGLVTPDNSNNNVVRVFDWSLDILAGNVVKMQHDTADIERYNHLRLSWDAKGSRLERANAALAYFTQKQHLREDRSGEIKTVIPDPVGTALSQALEREVAEVKPLEELLLTHSNDAQNKVVAHVDNGNGVTCTFSKEDRLAESAQLSTEKAAEALHCQTLRENIVAYNAKVVEMTAVHLKGLVAIAEANYVTNGELWASRTRYKRDIDQKNASLQYLLQRAVSAKDIVFGADASSLDTKKKGGNNSKNATGGGVPKKNMSKDQPQQGSSTSTKSAVPSNQKKK